MREKQNRFGEEFWKYFQERIFYEEKFFQILEKFAKVWRTKNIFVRICKSLPHANWTSKSNLMKSETNIFEYTWNLSNFTTYSNHLWKLIFRKKHRYWLLAKVYSWNFNNFFNAGEHLIITVRSSIKLRKYANRER